MKHKVFLDLDGILADFVAGICEAHKREDPYELKKNMGSYDLLQVWEISPDELWGPANSLEFWKNIKRTSEADDIMNIVLEYFDEEQVCFLTAPTEHHGCHSGKFEWIMQHYPSFKHRYLIGNPKQFCAGPRSLLIDDSEKNVKAFLKEGGRSILYPRPWNALHGLSKEESLSYLRERIKLFLHYSRYS